MHLITVNKNFFSLFIKYYLNNLIKELLFIIKLNDNIFLSIFILSSFSCKINK